MDIDSQFSFLRFLENQIEPEDVVTTFRTDALGESIMLSRRALVFSELQTCSRLMASLQSAAPACRTRTR
uniref:Uncharacterized protein n=2 Tax=Timema TaxID=61471 RepID=A0A7R9IDN0_9NEOP|nr:unnamed protein product [Timema bartmani]CAD7456127.1 unnamed protein product [Timema tahoe]